MYKKMFLMAGIASVLMTSCSEDDDNNNSNSDDVNGNGKFLIETSIKNPDGKGGATYMQLIPEFSGTIDTSKAIQLDLGSPTYVYGNDVFKLPAFGASGSSLTKYTYSLKGLTETGSLDLPANSMMYNIVKINEDKAYASAYALGKLWIINPKTLKKIGEIDLTSYAHSDSSPDPSYGYIRNGLYFLPLNQIGPNWMPYGDHLQVDVAIIDITTDKVLEVISEKTTGLSFPTRPFFGDMIFSDEQDDIYIACAGAFGYNPTYKKNGFVCIPKSKKEFDSSKSWDISDTSIEGTNYKSTSVQNCKYLGNGKLVAYVAVSELIDPKNQFSSKYCMAVTIDLKTKKIKQIKGIPTTDGHSSFIGSYKDLIVLCSAGKDKSGFFTYNPATEEVKLALPTLGEPAFFHSFE